MASRSWISPARSIRSRNFGKVTFEDESYWKMIGDSAKINVIATGVEEGKTWPLLWTYERGKGRIFVNILGHYTWTFDDPLFRILLLRGIAWSAGEPVDRFNELATIGAQKAIKNSTSPERKRGACPNPLARARGLTFYIGKCRSTSKELITPTRTPSSSTTKS